MIFTIFTFIVVLGILVFVHEGGHYLAARHVGIRVTQFSIGFPPRLWGRKVGDTEYMLSWIPLGGYVRLHGQNIEDEDASDPSNWASKSILQRLYVLVAGPAMNLALALVLMPVVYLIGVESPGYRKTSPVLAGVVEQSAAQKYGLRGGDEIVALEGDPTPTWNALFESISREAVGSPEITLTVLRGGTEIPIRVESSAFTRPDPFGWKPRILPVVGSFPGESAARAAGMEIGDRIIAIGNSDVELWEQIPGLVQAQNGESLALQVERGGRIVEITLQPRFDESSERWLIGISPPVSVERYGPVEAVAQGSRRVWQVTIGTFAFLGQLISGQGSLDALGGPVRIGAVLGDAARNSFPSLIFLMAIISLQLGILNLLPIPALDGGHAVMLALEKLKGNPLSPKVRERAQIIGFSLLMLLILVVTYNDILQLIS